MSDKPKQTQTPFHVLQAAMPAVPPDSAVTFGGRKFSYTGLNGILAAIRPVLNAHGWSITQIIQPDGLHTVLTNELNPTEVITSVAPLPEPGAGGQGWQAWGSALTYAKRYTIVALLGIVCAEPDLDEVKADAPAKPEPTPAKPAAAKPTIWTADELLTALDHWTDCRPATKGKQVAIFLQKNGLNAAGTLDTGMVRNVLADERREKLGPGMAEKLEATCNQIAP